MLIRLGALLAIVLAVSALAFDLYRSPIQPARGALVPSGAQGKLALPESEFKPVLASAETEMTRRFSSARSYLAWKRGLGWAALVISAGVSLTAAFYGRAVTAKADMNAADVLGNDSPHNLVRVVCVLIGISSILGLLVTNLDNESSRLLGAGKTLNDAIIEATSVLYDTDSTEIKARVALRRLQVAAEQP